MTESPRAESVSSADSVSLRQLRKTARHVLFADRVRISEEDLRDLINYRSNSGVKRSSDHKRLNRKVFLYPVVLDARKLLIQTACLYEQKEPRPIYHRALADTTESLMHRLAVEGDYMRSVTPPPETAEPQPLVVHALESFQAELEEKLDEFRDSDFFSYCHF